MDNKTDFVNNRQLDKVGVITDIHPIKVPLQGFTDALNCRFDENAILTRAADLEVLIGNHEMDGGVLNPENPPLGLHEHEGFWYYGTAKKLWRYSSNLGHTEVTRLQLDEEGQPIDPIVFNDYDDSVYWSFATFGSALVAVNNSNVPQILTQTVAGESKTEFFQDMPGWGQEGLDPNNPGGEGSAWNTDKLVPYNNFLLGFGMRENANGPVGHVGGDYPLRVRWSDIALPGFAPLSWNGATLTTNAGWNDLSDTKGSIVDIVAYQDSMIIFTERDIFQMKFVGGVDIFQFRKIFEDGGLLAEGCAVEFKGKQFCVGPNEIYIHDTSSKQYIADDKVKQRLYAEIGASDTDSVMCHMNEQTNEIWIMYNAPTGDDAQSSYPLDRIAAWNYENQTWSFFNINRALDIKQGVRPGEIDIDENLIWDQNEHTWDGAGEGNHWASRAWDGITQAFGRLGTVYCNSNGRFYLTEAAPKGPYYYPDIDDPVDEDGNYIIHPWGDRYVEKLGVNIADVTDRWCHINRIFPTVSTFVDGEGLIPEALFEVRITGSENQNQSPDWNAAHVDVVTFDALEDHRVDFRQTWNYLHIRIDFYSDTTYSVHGLDMDTKKRGRR